MSFLFASCWRQGWGRGGGHISDISLAGVLSIQANYYVIEEIMWRRSELDLMLSLYLTNVVGILPEDLLFISNSKTLLETYYLCI